jgi:hypothetical protein
VPLIESEASWAYQAWQISAGESIPIGVETTYLSATTALFSIFGSSDALARFWPACVGALIIWAPFLLRKHVGRIPALLSALGLAIDPALVSVSRIAASPMPALVFLTLAAASFHEEKPKWTIFFLGMGLLSGPAVWLGILLLILVAAAASLVRMIDLRQYLRDRFESIRTETGSGNSRIESYLLPLGLVILVGSFFLTNYQGLSSWIGSLPLFLSSTFRGDGIPVLKLLVDLAISNPLILIFGILGIINSWITDDRVGKISSLWIGISTLVILVIPGRQAADLIWLVFPFWILTARELFRIYNLVEDIWVVYALAALTGVLIVLNWLTFTGMVYQVGNDRAIFLHLGLIAASLALLALSISVVASEWDWSVSQKALGLGFGFMLFLFSLSSMAQGAFLRMGDPRSIWSDGSGYGQADLLLDSIYDASITQSGRGNAIAGIVVDDSESLRWILRDYRGFEFAGSLDPEGFYPVIITSDLDSYLVDPSIYRGQDFVIGTNPGWDGIVPYDWISWLAYRSGPVQKDHVILWIRNDIFSGY